MTDCQGRSEDTKQRLMEAAGEVFAQQGFRAATIREICSRAGTHVGAVNYHFGDKEGLYAAVLAYAHTSAMRRYPPDLGLEAGERDPEARLRAFVHSFLLRMLAEGFPAWYGKFMAFEIAEPTKAFDQLIENTIQPLFTYLRDIVSELLRRPRPAQEREDELTFLCATSIVGQCLHYFTARRVIELLSPEGFDSADIQRLTEHVTRFSLGAIKALDAEGWEGR